jgi:hypothetical protein
MPVLVSVYDGENRSKYAFMFVLHKRFVTEKKYAADKVFKHVSDFRKPVVAGFSEVVSDIQEWGDSFISAWCNLYTGNDGTERFIAGYCKECGRIAAVALGRRNSRKEMAEYIVKYLRRNHVVRIISREEFIREDCCACRPKGDTYTVIEVLMDAVSQV